MQMYDEDHIGTSADVIFVVSTPRRVLIFFKVDVGAEFALAKVETHVVVLKVGDPANW